MLSMIPTALYAQQMSRHTVAADRAMERVSSGRQLEKPWEDPGRFSVAETIHRQGEASQDVSRMLQDAINIMHIGEDGVKGIIDVVQQLRDTVVQAANGINNADDQAVLQTQLDTQKGLLIQAFNAAKNFRVKLDGQNNADRVLVFQVGTGPSEVMEVDYNPLRDTLRNLITGAFGYEELYNNPDTQPFLLGAVPQPLPLPTDIVPPPPIGPAVPPGTTWAEAFPKQLVVSPNTDFNIASSFALLDAAKDQLVQQDAYLGVCTNRLQAHFDSLSQFALNMDEAESKLRDADLAAESTALTRAQVLQQASQAMMAQANTRSLQVLDLLRQG